MSTHTSHENNSMVYSSIENIKTSYNANPNEIVVIGPTIQSVYLPTTPAPGTYVIIKKLFMINVQHFLSVCIFRNGSKINGLENDYIIYTINDVYLFYVNSTIGWITDYISTASKVENNKLTKFSYGGIHISGIDSSNGSIWSCGTNTFGQLGNNTTTNTSKPVSVVGGISFSYIAGGDVFSIGINGANGSAWAWGSNTSGQLGNYTRTSASSPVSVVGGFSFSKIISKNDFCVGINGADGSAWAWGNNGYGQLGNYTRTSYSSPISVLGGFSFKDIACGDYFSVGIRGDDGSAWAWGYGYYGRLGDYTVESKSSPVSVVGGMSFSKIFCSYENTVGIRGSDGSAWAWGSGSLGKNGQGSNGNASSPVSVLGGISFSQLSGGYDHWLGIRGSDGSVWGWGTNGYGQLGTNDTFGGVSYPIMASLTFSISEICSGYNNSIFVRGSDNFNFCCGYNISGQLGLNNTQDYSYVVMRVS